MLCKNNQVPLYWAPPESIDWRQRENSVRIERRCILITQLFRVRLSLKLFRSSSDRKMLWSAVTDELRMTDVSCIERATLSIRDRARKEFDFGPLIGRTRMRATCGAPTLKTTHSSNNFLFVLVFSHHRFFNFYFESYHCPFVHRECADIETCKWMKLVVFQSMRMINPRTFRSAVLLALRISFNCHQNAIVAASLPQYC